MTKAENGIIVASLGDNPAAEQTAKEDMNMFESDDMPGYQYDDGGRAAAGYKGKTGDCGCRAVAIATGKPYGDVYGALYAIAKSWKGNSRKAKAIRAKPSPRNGLSPDVLDAFMASIGWRCEMVKARLHRLPAWAYTPMREGIPGVVLYVRGHFTALVDETIRDIWDCRMTRENGECGVDEDWRPAEPKFVTRLWHPAA